MADEMLCFCGKPTLKSVSLARLRFEPPPPDEPTFQAPCCDDCHDVVWQSLVVERALYEANRDQRKLDQARAVLDEKISEWRAARQEAAHA